MNSKYFIVKFEKNYFFSSLLFNKNKYYQNNDNKIDDEFNQKIKEIFIQDVDIKNKIPENEMKFEIIIGFNLPSKNIIDEIISNINDNIINQYKENEYEFKNKFFEQEEEFETGKQQYENNLDLYKKITHDNINKNNLIKEIESRLSKGEKYKFYNLLLEDYLLTFIIKNFNLQKFVSNANIIAFIKIILINKFNLNEKNLNLEDISLIFNFIESYSMEIVSIIKMYIFLNSFKVGNELNQKIEEKISEINEKYNNIDIPENIKIINRVFYNTMETLINILIANLDKILLEIKTQENLNTLLDNLNNVYYSLLSINNSLNLSSKEIYILHETIKIISILTFDANEEEMKKNKKLVIDFIQKKIINSNKEKNDLKNKIEGPKLKAENNNNDLDKEIEDTEEEKYLKEHLNKFYDYYKEKNNINFSSLFSSVLFDEFNKEFNEKYRKYILEKILDDDNLIQHNILLIKIILSEYVKPDQEIIEEALDYISSEETYFPLLNQCNKEIVNNNIIKIFDSTINLYFNSLENIEEHIVSDLFDIFKEYLKVISDQNYEKYYNKYCNENLIKIYVLSYIKIYLNNFVNLLCDKKNALKEKEQIIIEEITKESSISNTIMFYFIILMFNKTNSLNILKDEIYKDIEAYSNNLQNEIGQNNFDNILNDLLIPKEDKYLFNEFFNYVKYPTLEDFESKFLSSKENQEKYPLINEFIKKDSGSKNLKYLNDYNDFINLMINYYSGKISRNDANNGEKSLNLEEIYKNDENNFKNKFDKFKNIWNNILSKYIKNDFIINNNNNLNKDKFIEKFEGNERLAYFLIDNNDNGYGIFIAKGLNKFIEWQNTFLKSIINAYKSKKNNLLNCYILQIEKSVNVQNANNLQILQIEKCFEKTYFINFDELISIFCERSDENINEFIYNFEKIEEELGIYLLPNKCLFNEKNIKYIYYQNEGFRNINYDYLIKFGKKYGEEKLT